MTADLLNALARILECYDAGLDDEDAALRICAIIGADPISSWPEIATALRTHAASLTPGLPEGWEWAPTKNIVMAQSLASDDCAWVNGDGIVNATEAPAQAVRAVLARAGVGS